MKLLVGHHQNQDCMAYHDYPELLARTDLDAVMIAVPDHWHALIATEAARQQKGIYSQEPLAKTLSEQQAIVRAVQANKVIWQTSSWQRSQAMFRKAAENVRSGLLGKLTHVEVGWPARHHSAIPGHLGLIAMLTGRKIGWNNSTETILGDSEASQLLRCDYRAPRHLA